MALFDLADIAKEWGSLPPAMKIGVIAGGAVVVTLGIAAYQHNKSGGSSATAAGGYPATTSPVNATDSTGAWTVSGGTTSPTPVATTGGTGGGLPIIGGTGLPIGPPAVKPPVQAPPISNKPAPFKPVNTYTVVAGDSLSAIASRHGLTLSQIEAKNPQFKGNFNLIHPGNKVNL